MFDRGRGFSCVSDLFNFFLFGYGIKEVLSFFGVFSIRVFFFSVLDRTFYVVIEFTLSVFVRDETVIRGWSLRYVVSR